MNLIFYWNKKIDEEYHTHMWTNRICTEKLLKEIDEYVSKYGFKRVTIKMCENYGWGDAFYLKT